MTHKSLLIVEDDPRSLYAFQAVLQARGYQVIACDSAEEALNQDGRHFDAAIIDVRLPKMQGTDLAVELRQKHADTHIIFVTAYNGVREIKAAFPQSDVLLKPIDMDNLLRLL